MYNRDMKQVNQKLNPSTAGLAYTANVAIYLIVNLLFTAIASAASLTEDTDGYKYLAYLTAPVALAIGFFAIVSLFKQKISSVAPIKCNYKYYIIALLMVFGLLFSVGKISQPVAELLKIMGYHPKGQNLYMPSLEGGMIVPALMVMAVLPALFEELLFRGLILNNCRPEIGDIRTVFICGFAFALFHASPEQTVYQFICGCAFSFLAVRSGSILPCMLMHFINNALIIIFCACGAVDSMGNLMIAESADIALTVLAAVAFVASVLWLIFDKKPLTKCTKGGVLSFFITASAGIIILIVLWIVSFVTRL